MARLKYIGADVREGFTTWSIGGDTYRLDGGSAASMRRIASTDPLAVRAAHGTPENFYDVDWRTGIMEVSDWMLAKFFAKEEPGGKLPFGIGR